MTRITFTNFAAGLLVGAVITAFVMHSGQTNGGTASAEPSSHQDDYVREMRSRHSSESFRNKSSMRRVSTPEGEHRNRSALKGMIFDNVASASMVEYLSKLDEEQAQKLAESLEDLKGRLNHHESQNAITVEESTEKLEIRIPPLFSRAKSTSTFRDELANQLGDTLADEFFRVAGLGLKMQFAEWGTAEQRLHIDLINNPHHVKARLLKPGSSSTLGTSLTSPSSRYGHLFSFEVPKN